MFASTVAEVAPFAPPLIIVDAPGTVRELAAPPTSRAVVAPTPNLPEYTVPWPAFTAALSWSEKKPVPFHHDVAVALSPLVVESPRNTMAWDDGMVTVPLMP